jgi:hypothetical protein
MTERVKIFFQMQQDEDGYPPITVESVWAKPAPTSGEYVLENIPFFFREATFEDTVKVREENGQLWFDGLANHSSNSLVRIVFHDRECEPRIEQELAKLGCEVEYFEQYNLLAVSIPGDIKLSDVQAYLASEADAGTIGYEEPILRQ